MPKKAKNKVLNSTNIIDIIILNDKDINLQHYEDIIRKARYLARNHFPYYTSSLMAITFKFTYKACDHEGNPTFLIDKHLRCYINPLIIDKWVKDAQDINTTDKCPTCGRDSHNKYAYLAGVILHEMCHPMQKHYIRAERFFGPNFRADICNIAEDCEINDSLLESIKFCNTENICLPDGLCLPSVFNMPDNLYWEQYYELLIKKFPPQPDEGKDKSNGQKLPPGGRCGSGADGVKADFEDPGEGECDNFDGVTEAELDTINRKVAQEMKEFAAKHPGSISGNMIRWADETIGKPKYDWRSELSNLIRYHANRYVSGHKMTTFSKRSIVSTVLMDKVILPTYKRPLPRVTLIYDVSGSMDNQAIQDSVAEGEAVLRLIKAESTIISCDTEAHIGKGKSMKQAKLVGGGGTLLNEGVKKALAQRDKPNLIILFSDGYDAFEMERPRSVEIIVCLCGRNITDQTIPKWMKIVRVEPESK